MNPSEVLCRHVLERWPLSSWQESTVVVGVSGGADSMALLECIRELRGASAQTIVAHYNHGMRGMESDDDQLFVESIASQLGMTCVVGFADRDVIANASEVQLRYFRHAFFTQVAAEHHAQWIALAHHADDQVETFLHNLMRGSGPSGLAGIPFSRPLTAQTVLVHPFLRVTRSQILEYLKYRDRSFRTDSSNATNQYTRNRIRNELLPMLRQFWSGEDSETQADLLDRRIQQASELIADEHSAIIQMAETWILKCEDNVPDHASRNSSDIRLPLQSCVEQCWPVVRQAFTILWKQRGWPLREMGHQHWRRLQNLIQAASTTTHPKQIDLPGGLRARCSRGWLIVTMQRTDETQ